MVWCWKHGRYHHGKWAKLACVVSSRLGWDYERALGAVIKYKQGRYGKSISEKTADEIVRKKNIYDPEGGE